MTKEESFIKDLNDLWVKYADKHGAQMVYDMHVLMIWMGIRGLVAINLLTEKDLVDIFQRTITSPNFFEFQDQVRGTSDNNSSW